MSGFLLALAAAALFGASAPASNWLLRSFHPVTLAGLFYLGAAIAMFPVVTAERRRVAKGALDRVNRLRLAGVVILGGVVAPILLLAAFRLATAGTVSLLLNLEIVATAVLGVALFHDHLSNRAWLGVAGVVAASALLSAPTGRAGLTAALLVVAACTCWGIDNHLSALIDGMTPARSTLWKGCVAGAVNLSVGTSLDPLWATPVWVVVTALAVGGLSYGTSIALHTAAAQRVGAVRAQAVFASAPFLGAALSYALLGEPVTSLEVVAAMLFLVSVVTLVAGQHEHRHGHGAAEHVHSHTHDDGHHQHAHPVSVTGAHTHWHRHDPVEHVHPHWPDLHHRHPH